MISSKKNGNRRKSGARQRQSQNLFEVKIRARAAVQQRNRFILTWTCRLLLIGGVVGVCIYGGRVGLRKFLWENPEYSLAAVEINDDGAALTRETIMNTAGLHIGQNVFSFSLAKAREAVAAMPQVDRVEMTRILPNKVAIDLTERRPVAWVSDGQTEDATASDKSFLIDSKRVLFKPKRRLDEYLRLPVVSGVPVGNYLPGEILDKPETTAALDLIQRNSDGGQFRIQCIDISKGYCMIATDAKRTQVTFALDKLDTQLERLAAILDRFAGSHQEIQTVNLLAEKNIPVTFAPSPEQAAGETEAETGVASAEERAPKAESTPVRRAVAAEDAPPKHAAAKSPTPAKKKTLTAENRERKKKPMHVDSDSEDHQVRRAERAAATPTPAPPSERHHITLFSLFHGQG